MAKISILILIVILTLSGISHAAITMSVDRDRLDFGTMENGQTKNLADQGVFHNQITCRSTNNITWYLKVNMMQPFTSGPNTIPTDSFRWEVADVVNGKGIVTNNKNIETPFTNLKSLVYTSDTTDNNGTDIGLRFRYHLTIPKNQISGNYFSYIRWTMTELL